MPTILIVDGNAAEIAARLLAAAGDNPDRVQFVTGGTRAGFSVDDELARAAGYVTDERPAEDTGGSTPVVNDVAPENPESDSEKTPAPAKAPAKRAPRTATK